MEALIKLKDMASFAYDIDILKEAYFLSAMVSSYFGKLHDAIHFYKSAVIHKSHE